jgi:hypothetical protein
VDRVQSIVTNAGIWSGRLEIEVLSSQRARRYIPFQRRRCDDVRRRALSLALVVAASAALALPSAEACSCAGFDSVAANVRASEILFVGTVTAVERPLPVIVIPRDGTVPPPPGPAPQTAVFAVERTFRGDIDNVVRLPSGGGSSCSFSFNAGERWLIYASLRDGRVETGKCGRTRLVAHARADFDYLEGLAAARPQGVVFGDLFRRGVGRDGRPGLFAPPPVGLIVVALAQGRRIEIAPDWGSYQLVLPPGSAMVWVEKDGVPVMSPVPVAVTDRGEYRVMLITEFDEKKPSAATVPW